MGEGLFTGMVALFWLAEFTFGALVVYWFVTQGFADEAVVEVDSLPLEDRAYTRKSLLLWAGFFAFIVLMIVVGA